MPSNAVSAWLDSHVDAMVELEELLTSAPALAPENGGLGEWRKARALEEWLRERGFGAAEHFDAPDERTPEGTRPNLVVTVPGARSLPRLWLLSHLDVVPPGEQRPDGSFVDWDSDPYTVRREDGLIYGRGVEDNHQAIVGSVFAALALIECGIRPALTLKLGFVADEETSSAYGLDWLVENHPSLFEADDLIVVPDGGNVEGSMIEVAEKSMLWLQFTVEGKQAHGSMPHKARNTHRTAARLACALDAGLPERFNAPDDLYDPPGSTFEPTMHEKNVPNVNTIPGKDVFCFDCRILPQFDLDDVIDYVRTEMVRVDAEVGTHTELTIRQRVDAPPATPSHAPVVKALERAIADVYGVQGRPMGVGGGTVAAFLRKRGLPAVVWSRSNLSWHQANEHCSLENLVGDAKVFAHVMQQDAR